MPIHNIVPPKGLVRQTINGQVVFLPPTTLLGSLSIQERHKRDKEFRKISSQTTRDGERPRIGKESA